MRINDRRRSANLGMQSLTLKFQDRKEQICECLNHRISEIVGRVKTKEDDRARWIEKLFLQGSSAFYFAEILRFEMNDIKFDPLPIPRDAEDLAARRVVYNAGRGARRQMYELRSLEGYQNARTAYYEAYRQIAFAQFFSYEAIRENIAEYTAEDYESDMTCVLYVLRRISICCSYLNLVDEGIRICEQALPLGGDVVFREIKWHALVTLSRLYSVRGDMEDAVAALERVEEWAVELPEVHAGRNVTRRIQAERERIDAQLRGENVLSDHQQLVAEL